MAYSDSVLNLQRAMLWARSQDPSIPSPGALDGRWGPNTNNAFQTWIVSQGLLTTGLVTSADIEAMQVSSDRRNFAFPDGTLATRVAAIIRGMPRAYRALGATAAPTSAPPPGTSPASAGAWDSTLPGGASATSDPVAQAQAQAAAQTIAQAQQATSTTPAVGGSFISQLFSHPAAAAAAAASGGTPLLTNTAPGPLLQAPSSSTQTALLVGLGVVAAAGVAYMVWSSSKKSGRRRRR